MKKLVYEKYIRKNGKLYGPYTYNSKRVDGKVVSEYHGTKKKSMSFNFLWLALGIVFLVILISGFLFFNNRFTGKVSLDITSSSDEAGMLKGILSLSLKEGELMPASSKVIFESGGTSYEYTLSDIIAEEAVEGNFYVEDHSIVGGGIGYGVAGTKIVYPDVSFTLNILSESKSEKSKDDVPEEVPEVIEKEVGTEIAETEIIEEVIEPEPVAEPEPEVSVTGAVIANFFRNTLDAFLILTGQVSLKITQEVDGSTSFSESFTYDLAEGETAEIKSDSVNINGESVSDSVVNLNIVNNQVVVTTDYAIQEEGFGEDYVDGAGQTISIDLSSLNLAVETEDVKVSFVYDNTELVSISTSGEIPIEIPEESVEVIDSNITEVSITNETINITKENVIIVVEFLTAQEKEILFSAYGNASVDITKAEKVRERVEVTFEFQSYSTTRSYDSGLSEIELSEWIERDRIRFLKDIANELSKIESSSEVVEGIIGSYGI